MSQAGRFNGGGPTPPGTAIQTLTADVGGPVGPTAGNVDILGGANINTSGNPGASSITVNLDESIFQPNTNALGTQGLYALGGNRFLHNFGVSSSTYVGQDAGNLTNTASFNTGVGSLALTTVTTGGLNTAIGSGSLRNLTTGVLNVGIGSAAFTNLDTGLRNVGIGSGVLQQLVSGSDNIAIGDGAGQQYTTNESNNILIGNDGTIGDNDLIRIGTPGIHNSAFVSGIYNTVIGATSGVVQIDNNHQLGSSNGTDGQLLIGGGTGPVWNVITSLAGTITILNGPNSINIEVADSIATQYDTDSGSAVPAVGVLNVFGNHGINTSGAGNTVTIALDNTITLGDLAVVTAGNDALTITSGDLTLSGTGVNAAANINLPGTDVTGAQGVITFNGNPWLHLRGLTVNNIFIGFNSGNFINTSTANIGVGQGTLFDVTTGSTNLGVGHLALGDLTSGNTNEAFGGQALASVTIGDDNLSVGSLSLSNLIDGSNNLAVGQGAGTAYTGTESSNIIIGSNAGVLGESNVLRIGVDGNGVGQQDTCFIAGILNNPINGQFVSIDPNTGQLGVQINSIFFSGSGTTVGAVTADIITISLAATPATWNLEASVSAFESSTPAGAAYQLFTGARTNGAAATAIGSVDQVVNEDAALVTGNATIVISGNSAILRVTGVAGLTIQWQGIIEALVSA